MFKITNEIYKKKESLSLNTYIKMEMLDLIDESLFC